MTTIILVKNKNTKNITSKIMDVEINYKICVVDSERLSDVIRYYKSLNESENLHVLKKYMSKIDKKNIKLKLENVFNSSLKQHGQKLFIIKKIRMCHGSIKNKVLAYKFDTDFTNRIKSIV
jgi:hypothetical protein